ncbi:hypothetical protein D3C72_1693400 [compost metagenome]
MAICMNSMPTNAVRPVRAEPPWAGEPSPLASNAAGRRGSTRLAPQMSKYHRPNAHKAVTVPLCAASNGNAAENSEYSGVCSNSINPNERSWLGKRPSVDTA